MYVFGLWDKAHPLKFNVQIWTANQTRAVKLVIQYPAIPKSGSLFQNNMANLKRLAYNYNCVNIYCVLYKTLLPQVRW